MNIVRELIAISIGAIFINNFVLSRFLGICPFIGVSKKLDSVVGMGLAVTFVMTLSSMITFTLYYSVLIPLHIEYLKIISFILIIASLVQIVELFLKKMIPFLYNSLGIYLPLITTNCVVLGVAVLNLEKEYNFIAATVHGFAGGLSFFLALFLMSTIRERLDLSDVPEPFKGVPIAFISAGLMALAFLAADKTMLNFINP